MMSSYKFSIALCFLVLIASVRPMPELPKLPIVGFDKLFHGLTHCLLINLLIFEHMKAHRSSSVAGRSLIIFSIVIVFFGLSIELIQGLWVPGRHAELADVYANSLGLATGLLLFRFGLQKTMGKYSSR